MTLFPQVSRHFLVGKFISYFVSTVVWSVFLYCVVRQMNIRIIVWFHLEKLTAGPNISLFIDIGSQHTIGLCQQAICPDVEFSLVVKKQWAYVLLDDVAMPSFFNFAIYFVETIRDDNAVSSITILAWLNQPHLAIVALLELLVLSFRLGSRPVDVEGQRNGPVLLWNFVKAVKYQETFQKRFFVANKPTKLQMVVYLLKRIQQTRWLPPYLQLTRLLSLELRGMHQLAIMAIHSSRILGNKFLLELVIRSCFLS